MSMSVVTAAATTLVATGILLVWDGPSPTLQEQTSFLERVSARMESAKIIAPETHLLNRTRNRPARDGIKSKVEQRWQTAMLRLERALQEKATARR